MGATVASLISQFPILITLSENKIGIFTFFAAFLALPLQIWIDQLSWIINIITIKPRIISWHRSETVLGAGDIKGFTGYFGFIRSPCG